MKLDAHSASNLLKWWHQTRAVLLNKHISVNDTEWQPSNFISASFSCNVQYCVRLTFLDSFFYIRHLRWQKYHANDSSTFYTTFEYILCYYFQNLFIYYAFVIVAVVDIVSIARRRHCFFLLLYCFSSRSVCSKNFLRHCFAAAHVSRKSFFLCSIMKMKFYVSARA